MTRWLMCILKPEVIGMKLSQLIKINPEAHQYFLSLPLNVQENLMQVGQNYESLEDLLQRGNLLTNSQYK